MSEYDNNLNTENTRSRIPKLRKFMDALGNVFWLNICFLVASLPIFTIGASLTALYSMCMRLQEDKEETVTSGFISEFKRNFKQATVAFLILLVCVFVMLGELIFINTNWGTVLSYFYTAFLFAEVLVFLFVVPFLFPMIARYDNKLSQIFKNSALISFGYIGSWIKILVAWAAPIILSVIYPLIFVCTWWLWVVLLFGLIAWGTTHTIRKVFDKNEQALENRRKP